MILMLFLRTCINKHEIVKYYPQKTGQGSKDQRITKNTEAMNEEIRYKN